VAEVSVTELKATASAVVGDVEDGAIYLVTKRGRPVAVLLPVADAEELVLANADTYRRMRRRARISHAEGRSSSLAHIGRSAIETKFR
jgi:prevent-host-death family protein